MTPTQYARSIRQTAINLGAKITDIHQGKHMKVYVEWNGIRRFIVFPCTPSNRNAEKRITKNFRMVFAENFKIQH
jgi:hypothetical protein